MTALEFDRTKAHPPAAHEHPDYIDRAIDDERQHGVRGAALAVGRGLPGLALLLLGASVARQARLAGVHVDLSDLLAVTR